MEVYSNINNNAQNLRKGLKTIYFLNEKLNNHRPSDGFDSETGIL